MEKKITTFFKKKDEPSTPQTDETITPQRPQDTLETDTARSSNKRRPEPVEAPSVSL